MWFEFTQVPFNKSSCTLFFIGIGTWFIFDGVNPFLIIHNNGFIGISGDIPKPHKLFFIIVFVFFGIFIDEPINITLALILACWREYIANDMITICKEITNRTNIKVWTPLIEFFNIVLDKIKLKGIEGIENVEISNEDLGLLFN